MNYTYLHYQIGLTLLWGVGPIKAKGLLQSFETLEDLFRMRPETLSKITGLKPAFIREMHRKQALESADHVIAHLNKNHIRPIFYDSTEYPRRLKNCVDAPLMLYHKGNASLNPEKIVAIVGTRAATSYGKQLCENLIRSFKGNNITVVSGLALGIDACAHQSCIQNDVPTIGVLGHGLDRIYPSLNRSIANKMLNDGALITEFIPGTEPDRENFPKRNRIVAGICDATIVIESKIKGGSLITAHLANDYNRDVFAFPGNVNITTSQGCNQLIRDQKAHLIQRPEDFLSIMNWNTEIPGSNSVQRILFPSLSAKQKSIVEIIAESKGVQIDVLSMKTSLPITLLNTELFHLEMEGVIRSLPGKTYAMA